jgi:hypothetical protein
MEILQDTFKLKNDKWQVKRIYATSVVTAVYIQTWQDLEADGEYAIGFSYDDENINDIRYFNSYDDSNKAWETTINQML